MYEVPGGDLYPSVTRVLGTAPHPELNAWIRAVGEEEAARVSGRASRRGTEVHAAAEAYLTGQLDEEYQFTEDSTRLSFLKLKEVLDARVGRVFATEVQLYSRILRSAGTCDLVCEWDGLPAVVDFKNLGRQKYDDELYHYRVQASVYATMIEEITSLRVKKTAVVTIVDTAFVEVYEGERDRDLVDYFKLLRENMDA